MTHMEYTYLILIGQSCIQWSDIIIKGLVHPKIVIISLITHPHVIPNL